MYNSGNLVLDLLYNLMLESTGRLQKCRIYEMRSRSATCMCTSDSVSHSVGRFLAVTPFNSPTALAQWGDRMWRARRSVR